MAGHGGPRGARVGFPHINRFPSGRLANFISHRHTLWI